MSTKDNYVFDCLKALRFPDYVCSKANEIYIKYQLAPRKHKSKIRLLFFCLCLAYPELGEIKDPKDIADELGMKRSDISRTLAAYSSAQIGSRGFKQRYHPTELISSYCGKLGLDSTITKNIIDFAEKCFDKNKLLLDHSPQAVAAGIIDVYATERGYRISSTFLDQIGVSRSSVLEVLKLIHDD